MLIGEVARCCGVSARMLRHYDALGLVRPSARTAGGYRAYSPEDVRRVFHVESLRSLGLTLQQVGRALEDPAFTPSGLIADLIRSTQERMERERELLERLRTIDASAPAAWQDAAAAVELLRDLTSTSPARRQQAVLTRPQDAAVPVAVLVEAVLAEVDPHVAGALRWSLAGCGGQAVAALAAGTRSGDVQVRRRAVEAIAAMPQAPGAAETLTHALGDPDAVVRGRAGLALGREGSVAAIPVLIAMVVQGHHDVEAAETLAVLSRAPGRGAEIVAALAEELAAPTSPTAARLRLAQALVELPGSAAQQFLQRLAHDEDRAVARLASALVTAPGGRTPRDRGGRSR